MINKHLVFFILYSLRSLLHQLFPVVGGVYLLYHVVIEKSIVWSDFNLQGADWELLQIGLVLFFLQVGMRKTEKQTDKQFETGRNG